MPHSKLRKTAERERYDVAQRLYRCISDEIKQRMARGAVIYEVTLTNRRTPLRSPLRYIRHEVYARLIIDMLRKDGGVTDVTWTPERFVVNWERL
jgi:hypothetical protein